MSVRGDNINLIITVVVLVAVALIAVALMNRLHTDSTSLQAAGVAPVGRDALASGPKAAR